MAVTTTTISVGPTWTDLGVGPMELESSSAAVLFAIADAQPDAGLGGFVLNVIGVPVPFQTTSHVWAKSNETTVHSVILAPISGTSGAAGAATGDVTSAGTSGAKAQAVQGLTGGVPIRSVPVALSPDTRSTFSLDATKTSGAGSFVDVVLNGQGIASLSFAGFAGGAIVTYTSSNNPAGTPASPISSLNASVGQTSGTRSADGETRIPVAGRTTLRLQVTTAGTGTIAGTVNVTGVAVSGIVDLGSPIPPGTNRIGGVTAADGDLATIGSVTDPASASAANTTVIGALRALRDRVLASAMGAGAANANTQRVILAVDNPSVAITEADGANLTLGAKGDQAGALPTTSGTVVSKLSGIWAALIGATPASQAGPGLGPTAALGVVQQDGLKATLSTTGAGNLATVTSADSGFPAPNATGWFSTAGFCSAIVDVTAAGVGNTAVVQFTSDGGTTVRTSSQILQGTNIGNTSTAVSLSQTSANRLPIEGPLMRIVETVAGTTPALSVVVTLKVTNVAPISNYVTFSSGLLSSNNPIGGLSVVSLSGGVALFSRLPASVAGTNLTLAKATAGRPYTRDGYNTTNAVIYLKLYNVSTLTGLTVGTTAPFNTIPLPPGAFPQVLAADIGWYMSAGIAYAFSSTATDTTADGTGISAGAITGFSLGYQ